MYSYTPAYTQTHIHIHIHKHPKRKFHRCITHCILYQTVIECGVEIDLYARKKQQNEWNPPISFFSILQQQFSLIHTRYVLISQFSTALIHTHTYIFNPFMSPPNTHTTIKTSIRIHTYINSFSFHSTVSIYFCTQIYELCCEVVIAIAPIESVV